MHTPLVGLDHYLVGKVRASQTWHPKLGIPNLAWCMGRPWVHLKRPSSLPESALFTDHTYTSARLLRIGLHGCCTAARGLRISCPTLANAPPSRSPARHGCSNGISSKRESASPRATTARFGVTGPLCARCARSMRHECARRQSRSLRDYTTSLRSKVGALPAAPPESAFDGLLQHCSHSLPQPSSAFLSPLHPARPSATPHIHVHVLSLSLSLLAALVDFTRASALQPTTKLIVAPFSHWDFVSLSGWQVIIHSTLAVRHTRRHQRPLLCL